MGSEMCIRDRPNTDDIRDSSSIKLANYLFKNGYQINCFDPVAMDNAKKEFNHFRYFESAFDACNNTNAIVIGTVCTGYKECWC